MTNRIALSLFLLTMACSMGRAQNARVNNSVLSTGKWFKVSVKENGIHKMDYNFLKSMGINPDQIDPKKLKLFSGTNGMLPQLNSALRIQDLQELPIFVAGEGDGRFNGEDYLLFYGQSSDDVSFDVSRKIFKYQNNLYSDKNFYFLTVADNAGKRVSTSENLTTSSSIINQYDDLGYYETDKYNILSSGRDWFGEQFDSKTDITVRFEIDGMVENSNIKLVVNTMAKSFDSASFKLFLNDKLVGEQVINGVENTSYALKGREAIDTILVNASAVGAANRTNQDFRFQYIKTSTSTSIGYLDYFLFSFKRKLALYGSQTTFRSEKSLGNPTSTFEIASTPTDAVVWDVTDPFNARIQNSSSSSSKSIFTTSTTQLKTFVVFKNDGLTVPAFEGNVDNQNLHELADLDFIIITHPNFKAEAQRLADHRTQHDKLSTKVVTVGEIYNEYAGGKQDITAIRDFLKDVYYRGNKRLANALLFGRCSYDYKANATGVANFVPTYESVNSLLPLSSYSSDDYFAFFEPSEGEWREDESNSANHTMEIGVGRLPIKSAQEAQTVVTKLMEYDKAKPLPESWQKKIVFVADDGDGNLHQSQADDLASFIEDKHSEFNVNKVYLDAFEQIQRPSGQLSPAAKKAIDKEVKEGALIINYTGHGSTQVLMQERVVDDELIKGWKNGPQYPLFVTATCEFGRHDNPTEISAGESILLQKNGGGIGLITTSRDVYANTNLIINEAFYNAVFVKAEGKYRTLGTIFKDTKNNSIIGISNRNFSLLGDPSMKLALAENQVVVNTVKTKNNSDTLRALSSVIITGEIKSGTKKVTDFSGTMEITLFDKEETETTLGDENPPFQYTTRTNALFRGKASVTQGNFQSELIIPKNIESKIGEAKLSLFASSVSGDRASGGISTIKIGLSEWNSLSDTNPPSIQLFMGDTSYVNGGLVGPNTTLVAKLQDISGINISNRNEAKSLLVRLDDTSTYVVNDYYLANKDTYTSGVVSFPMEGLTKGKHTLVLTASDSYNNTASASIDFVVTDGVGIVIDQFYNYPNPFNPASERATLQFVHSRPGEDLEASLHIFDMTGQLLESQQFNIASSPYRVILAEWAGEGANGNKLTSGIYLARLSVRSLLDGSKNEQSTRLIILN